MLDLSLTLGTTGTTVPQYPKDIKEPSLWLTDSTARVIVLDKTFDYTTSEGTVTGTTCKCQPSRSREQ
jgi:hypothetical protein